MTAANREYIVLDKASLEKMLSELNGTSMANTDLVRRLHGLLRPEEEAEKFRTQLYVQDFYERRGEQVADRLNLSVPGHGGVVTIYGDGRLQLFARAEVLLGRKLTSEERRV